MVFGSAVLVEGSVVVTCDAVVGCLEGDVVKCDVMLDSSMGDVVKCDVVVDCLEGDVGDGSVISVVCTSPSEIDKGRGTFG